MLGLPSSGMVLMLAALQAAGAQLGSRTVRGGADSSTVVREARRAVESFERTRRMNLPVSDGSHGRCDVRVGRFCYWHEDGEWDGPEEPAKIAAARRRLVEQLARAAERLPGDAWIAGQRVRYLVEGDRARDAVLAAAACRARQSWCAALAGFALHAAAEYGAADSAFDAALATMDSTERCRWTDISLLLEGAARDRYRKLGCHRRDRFERTFWGLARPFYLFDGNDLRTEHLSRVTMAELQRVSRSPHDMSWGDDMRELMLRYGWPTRWSRELASLYRPADFHIVGHEPTPSFDFIPASRALLHPDSAAADDWAMRDPVAQARYAPWYARSVAGLEHQLAFFRRADSALVVVAFDAARDTAFASDSIAAAIALVPPNAPESVRVVVSEDARRRDVLSAAAAWAPLIASIEARDSAARAVARARMVARPPAAPGDARVTVSDLLLFSDAASLPASLEEALPRTLGSLRLRADVPVGLFWEMYGVRPDGETLSYSVTVRRENVRWYRRAAERAGLAERLRPVRLEWSEPAGHPGSARSRALALDLSTLPEGRYRIELTLEATGQAPTTVSRVVEVER